MAYSIEADVRAATGMNDATRITSATVTGRIAFADGIINGKVGSVYALPLSVAGAAVTPDLVHFLSIEIASLMLYWDNYGEETQNTDKGWKKRLDAAYSVLEDIRTLKLQLYDGDGNELDRSTLRQPSGYPDDASSSDTATNSTAPRLPINAIY